MANEITPTIADYLEAIYNMIDEGKTVIAARVADRMDVSRPTVSATLRRMRDQDLVSIDADNQITLTERGLQLARENIRRHRLAERFLTDLLGLEWHVTHTEAHNFEHGLSPLVEERLFHLLGEPTTCPHGNPIPGSRASRLPANAVTLDQLPPGVSATVLRITEEGERDLDLLRRLQQAGIVPGAQMTAHPADDLIEISSPKGDLSLPARQARTIWVQPVS
ncbi:MAG: metal-dependent transcriptional regulator [Ardenticatenaceae bacterium]|nr:metal-dependent transcriptional regulator [Ardenticatenaceae bacterium]HBY92974.1 metal-dependent transcriptional regulator [Chloroflexota bacterium]